MAPATVQPAIRREARCNGSFRGHVTSALVQTLESAFDTRQLNVTSHGALDAAGTQLTTRTYLQGSDILTEIVNARVWIGFHYRTSVIAGENLGESASSWALTRYFQPTDGEGED